jgi:hypothetical protein
LTAQKLNAVAALAFPPEGVSWTLDAAADQVLASTPQTSQR